MPQTSRATPVGGVVFLSRLSVWSSEAGSQEAE